MSASLNMDCFVDCHPSNPKSFMVLFIILFGVVDVVVVVVGGGGGSGLPVLLLLLPRCRLE